MAKRKKTTKDLTALEGRLKKGALTKSDVAYLTELIDHAKALTKALETSKKKSGGKTLIASLPFGVDIVK